MLQLAVASGSLTELLSVGAMLMDLPRARYAVSLIATVNALLGQLDPDRLPLAAVDGDPQVQTHIVNSILEAIVHGLVRNSMSAFYVWGSPAALSLTQHSVASAKLPPDVVSINWPELSPAQVAVGSFGLVLIVDQQSRLWLRERETHNRPFELVESLKGVRVRQAAAHEHFAACTEGKSEDNHSWLWLQASLF